MVLKRPASAAPLCTAARRDYLKRLSAAIIGNDDGGDRVANACGSGGQLVGGESCSYGDGDDGGGG